MTKLEEAGNLPHQYTASQPTRPRHEPSSPWKPKSRIRF